MKKHFVRMMSLASVVLVFSAFGLVSFTPVDAAGLFSRNILPRCSMEAKICPNGTTVTRSGPYCEFAPCKTAQPPVMCPQDALMCPDGSFVGRIAPRCEFASCGDTREIPIGKIPKKPICIPNQIICSSNLFSKVSCKPAPCPLPQELVR